MSGRLDHLPSKVLQQRLIDATLGTAVSADGAWPVFAGHLPSTKSGSPIPNNAICVYDTDGTEEGSIMIDGLVVEKYGIQVKVRADDHGTGFTKMEAIQNEMDKVINRTSVTVGSTTYMILTCIRSSGIIALGINPTTHCSEFTLNYLLALGKTS